MASRVAAFLVLFVLCVTACGGGGADDLGPEATAPPTTAPRVVGKDIQFSPRVVVVPAGQAVTLTFANQDPGIQHDLVIKAPTPPGTLATPLLPGPRTDTLPFTIPRAGRYQFICTIHPDMTGSLIVK